MFVQTPDFSANTHVALVTGPAQVWYAAAAAMAAGVPIDRVLFMLDRDNSPLLEAVRRCVRALDGVMWSDETSLAWYSRPSAARVMWTNKTWDMAYAVEAARKCDPGVVVQYADGFIAPTLVRDDLPRWSQTDGDETEGAGFTGFSPDYVALCNAFGNFALYPRQGKVRFFEVPNARMSESLARLQAAVAPADRRPAPDVLLATTVYSERHALFQRWGRIASDQVVDAEDELRLYRAVMKMFPTRLDRAISLHPRTSPEKRKRLEQIVAEEGWRVLTGLDLAEQALTAPGSLVASPPSSILFTASRICGARTAVIDPEILDRHMAWWKHTDLDEKAVALCRSAGVDLLEADADWTGLAAERSG